MFDLFEKRRLTQTSIEYPLNAVRNLDQQSASDKDVKKLLDVCFAWFLNQFGMPKNMWTNLERAIDQDYDVSPRPMAPSRLLRQLANTSITKNPEEPYYWVYKAWGLNEHWVVTNLIQKAVANAIKQCGGLYKLIWTLDSMSKKGTFHLKKVRDFLMGSAVLPPVGKGGGEDFMHVIFKSGGNSTTKGLHAVWILRTTLDGVTCPRDKTGSQVWRS